VNIVWSNNYSERIKRHHEIDVCRRHQSRLQNRSGCGQKNIFGQRAMIAQGRRTPRTGFQTCEGRVIVVGVDERGWTDNFIDYIEDRRRLAAADAAKRTYLLTGKAYTARSIEARQRLSVAPNVSR
jgi:hypothetical protein